MRRFLDKPSSHIFHLSLFGLYWACIVHVNQELGTFVSENVLFNFRLNLIGVPVHTHRLDQGPRVGNLGSLYIRSTRMNDQATPRLVHGVPLDLNRTSGLVSSGPRWPPRCFRIHKVGCAAKTFWYETGGGARRGESGGRVGVSASDPLIHFPVACRPVQRARADETRGLGRRTRPGHAMVQAQCNLSQMVQPRPCGKRTMDAPCGDTIGRVPIASYTHAGLTGWRARIRQAVDPCPKQTFVVPDLFPRGYSPSSDPPSLFIRHARPHRCPLMPPLYPLPPLPRWRSVSESAKKKKKSGGPQGLGGRSLAVPSVSRDAREGTLSFLWFQRSPERLRHLWWTTVGHCAVLACITHSRHRRSFETANSTRPAGRGSVFRWPAIHSTFDC